MRTIQGCCQDICLFASLHVQREPQEEDAGGGALDGYTPAGEAFLEDIGRYTRVAHVLFWSARGAAAPDYIVSQSSADRRIDQVRLVTGQPVSIGLATRGSINLYLYLYLTRWRASVRRACYHHSRPH